MYELYIINSMRVYYVCVYRNRTENIVKKV